MIRTLEIVNFKSHLASKIRLGDLTVLTGVNGCGKTAVTQALLLLRQSFVNNRLMAGLDLNRPLCSIGTGQDALCRWAPNGIISFVIGDGQDEIMKFSFDAENGLDDSFLKKHEEDSSYPDSETLTAHPLFSTGFQYIGASRWGGRSLFPKDTFAVEQQRQLSLQEGQGELVAHFLNKYGVDDIDDYCDGKAADKSLLAQTIYWERKVSPGVTLTSQPSGNNSDSYVIDYGFEPADKTGKPLSGLRAENIGYGISYALPVIVALLSATPGNMVIIENPEAHLHPSGQAEIADLIARVAANGVQVIVETHSDHIITGIQLAVKNGRLSARKDSTSPQVVVNYLTADNRHCSRIEEIEIGDDGILNQPPPGFFDRAEMDFRKLYANEQG